MPRPPLVCLLLAALIAQPAAAEVPVQEAPWSGMIAVSETINGPNESGGDQRELEHFAHMIEDRLRQARGELATAPAFVARVIREDIGFYETELERVVAARGGALTVGRTSYIIKGDRMLLHADGARLLIDRVTGNATGLVDGQSKSAKLQEVPPQESLDRYPAGPEMLGYGTRRLKRTIKGRSYVIDVAPGLPNPYAIGLIENGQDDDLVRQLSELPGLPMMVSETSGEATRSLCVTCVDRHEVADAVFKP